MKKMCVLSIVLTASTLCMYCIARHSCLICENIDAQNIKGGCVAYSDTAQCEGSTTKCSDVACGVQGGPARP
jgi:hypothetical protein